MKYGGSRGGFQGRGRGGGNVMYCANQ